MKKLIQFSLLKSAFLSAIFSVSAYAEPSNKTINLATFSAIKIEKGVVASVSCGEKNQAYISSESLQALDSAIIEVNNNVLSLSYKSSWFSALMGKQRPTLRVSIDTTDEINTIRATSGSILNIPGCALADDTEIDMSSGSQLIFSGQASINTLNLDLSTGAGLKQSKTTNIAIEQVNFDLSTGAFAYVCNAKTIRGDGSTGASIITAASTKAKDNLDFSTGANWSKRCP